MTVKPRAERIGDGSGGRWFRPTLGLIAVLGGLLGLLCLYLFKVPEGNREPLLLALGIVLGWGGQVVQSEYGGNETSRRLARTTIDQLAQPLDITVSQEGD